MKILRLLKRILTWTMLVTLPIYPIVMWIIIGDCSGRTGSFSNKNAAIYNSINEENKAININRFIVSTYFKFPFFTAKDVEFLAISPDQSEEIKYFIVDNDTLEYSYYTVIDFREIPDTIYACNNSKEITDTLFLSYIDKTLSKENSISFFEKLT